MFTTLVAVIAALVLGHLAALPLAALRDWHWFGTWLRWWRGHGGGWASGRFGLLPAIAAPVLLAGLLQWWLHGRLYGLPALLFGVAMLVWCWGPRDLDRDVEAVLDAEDTPAHGVAVSRLQAAGGSLHQDAPSLLDATIHDALRRWFAPLFWFLLLGPAGVLLYRLLAQVVHGPQAADASADARAGAGWALALLEWPVAQLMVLSMALVGNFDTVFSAWRGAAGNRWALDLGFLGAATRAGVGMELAEDAEDARAAGIVLPLQAQPELRDAMSLVWRMLLAWMAALALLVIAGWVA